MKEVPIDKDTVADIANTHPSYRETIYVNLKDAFKEVTGCALVHSFDKRGLRTDFRVCFEDENQELLFKLQWLE